MLPNPVGIYHEDAAAQHLPDESDLGPVGATRRDTPLPSVFSHSGQTT